MIEKQDKIDFWAVKHAIDDEVKRIGWSKEQCKEYIKIHYNKSTRLAMNDAQLMHLLSRLHLMESPNTDKKLATRKRKNRRRRRKYES